MRLKKNLIVVLNAKCAKIFLKLLKIFLGSQRRFAQERFMISRRFCRFELFGKSWINW